MDRASRRPRSFFCLSALVSWAAHRDRHQRNTRLTQFATIKCTTPLEYLVRVHTMGLRHLGYAGARLQRQLHNLKLLRNRPETAKTTTRTQPHCVRHEPIFGSPISLSLVGTRRTLTKETNASALQERKKASDKHKVAEKIYKALCGKGESWRPGLQGGRPGSKRSG